MLFRCCPASSSWQICGLGKVGDQRVGQAQMDVSGPVPGQGCMRAHGVVLDPVVLGVGDQVQGAGDFFEEQLLVLQRAETALP
jgi:hypothetical protein